MSWLPLASGGLDRAAHRRRDEEWLAGAWPTARVLAVHDGLALVTSNPDAGQDLSSLVLLDSDQVPEDAQRVFLGIDKDETAYFAAFFELPELPGATPQHLRQVWHALSDQDGCVYATAVALESWHSRYRYCPATGQPTVPAEAGWTRVTADGVSTHWPRTDPAAIVLVNDGVSGPDGRCLLASNVAWKPTGGLTRFSCLAGFVESGESLEQAVGREVLEEVGVGVWDITYVASQPWPFPGSLMTGFTALADPIAEVQEDQEEITKATWFTRSQIQQALVDENQAGFGLPMSSSIARYLITQWAREE
jgi:NAD+ diphosphatase